jgi:hypothetical protein
MNKRRRQPLRRRLKIQPNDFDQRRDSQKGFIRSIAPAALIAPGAAVVIGLGAFFLLKFRNAPLSHSAKSPIVAATMASPSPVEKESQISPASENLDAAQSGAVVAEESTQHQTPAPTPISSAPLPEPSAIVSDSKARDAKLSEGERKSIEKERRKAERKRLRLETMYQKHEISDEAYKKGQDEYKTEMAKYRSVMDGSGSANE